MEKVNISRDNFKSSLLKQIVIRIDYSEITNFEGFIQTIASSFKKNFSTRGKYQTNNINVTINEKDLAQDRVPIAVLPPNEVYRFTSCIIEPIQDVVLDVANTFVCLIINCNNDYDRLDAYICLLSEVMKNIFEYDSYTTVQRVGLRKIDGQAFDSLEAAKTVFEYVEQAEPPLFSMETYQFRVTSFMINRETGIQVNLSRKYNMTDDKQYQVELDIDGYIGVQSKLEDVCNQDKVASTLQAINNLLFELFKTNVTTEFLKQGVIE